MSGPDFPEAMQSSWLAACRAAADGDIEGAASRLRECLLARRGSLTLPQTLACQELLGRMLAVSPTDATHGLAVILYGQGARDPSLVLRAFVEFLAAGNAAQAARFLPIVAGIEGGDAALARSVFHRLRGEPERAAECVRQAAGQLRSELEIADTKPEECTLAELARRAARIDAAFASTPDAGARTASIARDCALAHAASEMLHVEALRSAFARLLASKDEASAAARIAIADALGRAASTLVRLHCSVGLEAEIESASRHWPGEPELALAAARLERRRLASAAQLAGRVAAVAPERPGFGPLREYVAELCYLDGDAETEAGLPGDGAGAAKAAHLRLHRGEGDEEGEVPQPESWPGDEDLGALLGPMLELTDRRGDYDDPMESAALRHEATRRIRALSVSLGGFLAQDAARVLPWLDALTRRAQRRRTQALYAEIASLPPDAAFGRRDPRRQAAIRWALLSSVEALARRILDSALAGDGVVSLAALATVAERYASAAIEAGDPSDAARFLGRLAEMAGDAGGDWFRLLQERCQLSAELPDADAVSMHLRLGMDMATVHPLHGFLDWSPSSEASLLADEASLDGEFSIVDLHGAIRSLGHSTPPERLYAKRVDGALVRDSWLLVDREGALLQPPPAYRLSGDYPYSSEHLLARGTRGAVLAAATGRGVEVPLLVLGNNDLLHHRNYYHWLIHGITRIHAAKQLGLLDGRRILYPEETRPWMDELMDLIGVGEAARFRYSRDEALLLRDALVLSPMAWTPPALLRSLAARLRESVGESAAEAPLLYLTRRGALRRAVGNEDRLCAIAESEGFLVVAPETLPVNAQLRLFAGARGVAARNGAALSGTLMCSPGTRVLVTDSEDDSFPTFPELAISLGHECRVMHCAPDARFADILPIDDAPYLVDEARFRTQLRWVAGGATT